MAKHIQVTDTLNSLSDVTYTATVDGQVLVWNNTSSLFEVGNITLGGVLDAADNDITNVKLVEFQDEHDNGNSTATATINWGNGNNQKITLTANCTLSFTAPSGPCRVQLKVIQDATGSRTITWPTMKWPGGTAPTLTTTANAEDIVTIWYDGASYYGLGSLDFQ